MMSGGQWQRIRRDSQGCTSAYLCSLVTSLAVARVGHAPGHSDAQRATLEPVAIAMAIALAGSSMRF
jgi:hypothetical protein